MYQLFCQRWRVKKKALGFHKNNGVWYDMSETVIASVILFTCCFSLFEGLSLSTSSVLIFIHEESIMENTGYRNTLQTFHISVL